jgi:hypothetical protein
MDLSKPEIRAIPLSPQALGTLNLEITLKTSVAKSSTMPACFEPRVSPNLHYLSKAAFQPRTFAVTIEKGRCIHDREIGRVDMRFNDQWGLHLVWEKSPYPAQEGLAHPRIGYDCSGRFDTMTTCVARELNSAEIGGRRAMNDPTITSQDFIRPLRKVLGIEMEEYHMCGTCVPVFWIWSGGREAETKTQELPE